MTETALERQPGDSRRYAIVGVGSLRVGGFIARTAVATDLAGQTWQFRRRGRAASATDASGTRVGEYRPIGVGRGGTVVWGARELRLGPAGNLWQERYRITDGRGLAMTLDEVTNYALSSA